MPADAEAELKKAKLEKLKFQEYISTKFRGDQSKQDPEAHFLLFTKLCEELKYVTSENTNWDSVKKLFWKTLAEKALLWYNGFECGSFEELKQGFLRQFSGSHGVSGDLNIFNTLTWEKGETALEFRNRLHNIADRLSLPETLVKHRFIHGLPENVKIQLLPFFGQEMKSLLDMAQNLLNFDYSKSVVSDSINSGVNCAESLDAGKHDVSLLRAEVGLLRKDLSEVKEALLAGGCCDSYHSESYLSEGTDEMFYGDESPESFYSRYNARRPYGFRGRGRSRGQRRGYVGYGRSRGGRNSGESRPHYDGPRAEGSGYQPTQNSGYQPSGQNASHQSSHPSQDAGPKEKFCQFCKKKGHWWQNCFDLKWRFENNHQVFQ
jgi:hypothetical protein